MEYKKGTSYNPTDHALLLTFRLLDMAKSEQSHPALQHSTDGVATSSSLVLRTRVERGLGRQGDGKHNSEIRHWAGQGPARGDQ
jgi:hypothetical protein